MLHYLVFGLAYIYATIEFSIKISYTNHYRLYIGTYMLLNILMYMCLENFHYFSIRNIIL